MSTKINLYFQTKFALDFLSEGIPVKLIRLLGIVQLKFQNEWSSDEPVIIDTGNPISVILFLSGKMSIRRFLDRDEISHISLLTFYLLRFTFHISRLLFHAYQSGDNQLNILR